ncbi:DsbC family protein [Novosphingobium album (ex Liu et al. 2023)]|uniref:Thiol:disulfide interchange protein n=1 Tax=Novosphingobium album (ex Liu et al. 2023) TaxID=3031130 RepID=A0ABT5WS18_9SPHN|nr:DsbC family protein [Novosphingobium album (ex Liu et al. 2023)]MDE8652850.1 DsbC family protein [Novosphingobium album (ex Liu et al. 2023)]
MSAIDRLRLLARPSRLMAATVLGLSVAGIALAADTSSPEDRVRALLKTRLPKTAISAIDCGKIGGLCEITAGDNLFYVDTGARYLVVGRVYDMQTRQDITAARLLEMNPDMLVGSAAKANAAAAGAEEDAPQRLAAAPTRQTPTAPAKARKLSLSGLPQDGAIVWGNPSGQTVTVFTDFRCGYCRALTAVLKDMNLRVIERPISVLGSREVADRVYCAKNREAALHAAYAGEPLKAGPACNTSGLDANEAFAHRHGLNGTPVIVRSDGAVIEGYRPRAFLEQWLRETQS